MIDSVTLKIQPAITPKEIYSKTESYSGYSVKGKVKNLILTSNEEYSILKGSLPKYLKGSNIEHLSLAEIITVTDMLENELQTDISNAQILNIEWGSTIQTDFSPKTYYSVLGQTYPFERIPHKSSVYYNGRERNLIFYDKGKEANLKGNHLKYELRLPKAKRLGLTLSSLIKPEAFNRLTKSWIELYYSLNKIRKPMPKEVKSQRDLTRFLESIGIEMLGGKDEVLQMIDNLYRQGKIKDYNRTRMRQNIIEFIENTSTPNDLEIELNKKFQEVANQNTIRD